MAQTTEGRALTAANQRRQALIAAQAMNVAASLWDELDISDLDASTPAWLGANLTVAQRYFTQSAQTTAAYVSDYRKAELGADIGPLVQPKFDLRTNAHTLLLAGPVRVKLLVGSGMDPNAALAGAKTKYLGMMSRQTLAGGRKLIDLTAKKDTQAVGWRRVTSGAHTCTFCAMLASRGPVYGSKEKAEQIAGTGLHYHSHCACTAELIYGEWQPNEYEQGFIAEYEKAAQEANDAGQPRTQETVLWRMRRNGAFNDSPKQ